VSAITYHQMGTGAHKVLCLNGWLGHAKDWGGLTQYLDLDNFTYVFMDYRGYGMRHKLKGNYDMAEISADALALVDQLGWGQFSLLGHSMGGMAIQKILAQAPDRVKKLVALCPVPASGVPFDDEQWALFSSAVNTPEARGLIIDFTTGNRLPKQWIEAMVQSSVRHATKEAFAGYLQAWVSTDFAAQIRGLELPVLVLVGENDPGLSAEFCEQTWLQFYPQASLSVISNAGHYPMFETPLILATEIEKFLAA